MKVPEWILTSFDDEIRNADIDSYLEEEFIDMTVDLETRALFSRKGLREFCINENNVTKYPQLSAILWAIFARFPKLIHGRSWFQSCKCTFNKRVDQTERGGARWPTVEAH